VIFNCFFPLDTDTEGRGWMCSKADTGPSAVASRRLSARPNPPPPPTGAAHSIFTGFDSGERKGEKGNGALVLRFEEALLRILLARLVILGLVGPLVNSAIGIETGPDRYT